jgi:hypothetical protein
LVVAAFSTAYRKPTSEYVGKALHFKLYCRIAPPQVYRVMLRKLAHHLTSQGIHFSVFVGLDRINDILSPADSG